MDQNMAGIILSRCQKKPTPTQFSIQDAPIVGGAHFLTAIMSEEEEKLALSWIAWPGMKIYRLFIWYSHNT